MGFKFANRDVVVTGGAQSIGFEIASHFCRERAMVSVFDYNSDALGEVIGQLQCDGHQVNSFFVDVSVQE